MVRHASLFSQLVALFHRGQFFNLVYRHQAERYAKGFSSWDHFVAMLFCQLAQAKSLREICDGKKHDVTIASKVPLSPYSIVAMDRGYNDYGLFDNWTENHIFFVTRLKDNADYTAIEDRQVPFNRNILADQLIEFNGYEARKKCPHTLRKVVVWDKEQNREIVLLTNHLEFGATTISAIYKDRWQIEIYPSKL